MERIRVNTFLITRYVLYLFLNIISVYRFVFILTFKNYLLTSVKKY